MGKKKDKKEKRDKAPKAVKAAKLPKAPKAAKAATEGGVPEGIRKAGKAALKFAESPVVGEAVAAALLAAAAALRNPEATKKGVKAVGDAAADGGAVAAREGSVIGDAVKAVAFDVAKRTMAAWEESGRKSAKPKGDGQA